MSTPINVESTSLHSGVSVASGGGGRFGPVEGGGAPASNERDQNCYVDRDRFSVIKLIIIVSGAFGPPRAMINDPLGAVRGGGGPHR